MSRLIAPFLTAILFLASAGSAQSLTLIGTIGSQNISANFDDFGGDVTTGLYFQDPEYEGSNWTREKVNNNIVVYNGSGIVVCTWVGAANSANSFGTITDGPGAGNYGGTWSRPGF